ncbi:MAG: DUF2842 domain-containing protein, partial [Rhizobiales bacterium]|nr:DUF2842 domain-containing protein [Hyphomicrobiales bacterium]
ALLVMIVLYAGTVVTIADLLPAEIPVLIQLVFFAVSGIGWIWPAKWIINWSRR